jgi:hypothetical protein
MTVRDFITNLLVTTGTIPQGEVPNASEATFVFNELNVLADQWNVDGGYIFQLSNVSYNLVPGQDGYTLGGTTPSLTGSVRPARIRNAAAVSGGFSFPVDLINSDEYNQILERAEAAKAPRRLWCDYGYPQANVKVWPTPNAACVLQLLAWLPIAQFTDLDGNIDFPPAYLAAMKFGLAVQVYPSFPPMDQQVYQGLVALAGRADQKLREYNLTTLGISMGAGQPAMPAAAQPAA